MPAGAGESEWSANPHAARWRGWLADAAIVLFVMALGAKAAIGAASVRDADVVDEWACMYAATSISERGLPSVEWSPMYVLWDRALLSCGVPPEEIPVASWSCLATLVPAALCLLVLSLGGGRLAALLAAGMLPATTLIDVYPYSMHLASLVLVLGTALAARLPSVWASAVLALSLLCASYARPEFLYSLIFYLPPLMLVAMWTLCCRPARRRAVVASMLVFAPGAALLFWAFGSPLPSGERPIVAFGQHYAQNRYEAGPRTEPPTHPAQNWEQYLRADFAEASTLGQVWRNNHQAFLWHVKTNAISLPRMLSEVAAPRVDLSFIRYPYCGPLPCPSRHPRTEMLVRRVLLLTLGCALFGTAIGLRRQFLGNYHAKMWVGGLMLILVASPALAASLTIYPRFHYLIPTMVFVTAVAGAGARHFPRPQWLRGTAVTRLALVAAAAGLALVVPNRAHGWCIQAELNPEYRGHAIIPCSTPIHDSVRTIRALKLPPPVKFLDNTGAVPFYSGLDLQFVGPFSARPGEGFLAFVERTGIGVFMLEATLASCVQFRDDPDFRAVVEGNANARFRLIPVAGQPQFRIAVRRDLLPAGSAVTP